MSPAGDTHTALAGRSEQGGSTVWNTSVQLPAVPIANEYRPRASGPGRNESARDPSSAPPPRLADFRRRHDRGEVLTHEAGLSRFARMFVMRNGCCVQMASESDERRICPPPSPSDPSISIISAALNRPLSRNSPTFRATSADSSMPM